jgi:hypothetical protein
VRRVLLKLDDALEQQGALAAASGRVLRARDLGLPEA